MPRTKWMRLIVRDLGDVMRWASRQQARHIDDFRYRVIGGRETVSFRLVPDYAIRIGTRDIVVVAHVRPRGWRGLAGNARIAVAAFADNWRALLKLASERREPAPAAAETSAEIVYAFPPAPGAASARS